MKHVMHRAAPPEMLLRRLSPMQLEVLFFFKVAFFVILLVLMGQAYGRDALLPQVLTIGLWIALWLAPMARVWMRKSRQPVDDILDTEP